MTTKPDLQTIAAECQEPDAADGRSMEAAPALPDPFVDADGPAPQVIGLVFW